MIFFAVNYDGTGEAYYDWGTDGNMIEQFSTPGNNSAMFMLFNPVTNKHYLMFKMGDASSGSNNTKLALIVPNGSVVTRSDDAGELTINGTTGSGNWDWNGGHDGGVIELPDNWTEIQLFPDVGNEAPYSNPVVQGD